MSGRETVSNYSPEVRERAVRVVLEHQGEASQLHLSQTIRWPPPPTPLQKPNSHHEPGHYQTLRKWVQQPERDQGLRGGTTTAEQNRIKELEREVRELRRTNEILRKTAGARWKTPAPLSWRRCGGRCA